MQNDQLLFNYIKNLDKKDLIEIINFLLDWLEEEHMGTKAIAKEEIVKTWGVDLW